MGEALWLEQDGIKGPYKGSCKKNVAGGPLRQGGLGGPLGKKSVLLRFFSLICSRLKIKFILFQTTYRNIIISVLVYFVVGWQINRI